ncbi:hypothetical protein WJX82_004529 [Trebouxia sp. C0006]
MGQEGNKTVCFTKRMDTKKDLQMLCKSRLACAYGRIYFMADCLGAAAKGDFAIAGVLVTTVTAIVALLPAPLCTQR